MKIAAITGSIGCGKTTLAGLAKSLGYAVFDADGAVRRLYRKKWFLAKAAAIAPQAFTDGVLDKRALRGLAFSNAAFRRRLEALIHPLVRADLLRTIRRAARRGRTDILFIDIALLFETGAQRYCDFVIVAAVGEEIQKRRVMARDGISAAEFKKIAAAQMDSAAKALLADAVVDTDKPEDRLLAELIDIIEEIDG